MLYDYGKTLDAYKGGYDIGNATRLRDLQVRAGQLAQGGNYEGAAQALLGGGDFQTGVPLLGAARQMGEYQQTREADKQFMKLWNGGQAQQPGAPAQSLSSLGQGGGAFPSSLVASESGGNWQAQNDARGAGGKVGHFGRLQFGQARLQEAQAAGVIPPGTTPQQFMQDPELQKRAEQWHFADIDGFIQQNGLDRAIGQRINGVPITVDGMRAVAHLGGKEGLRKFIASGGQYNPADRNGTTLLAYLQQHAGETARGGVQVANNEADVQRLEAQMAGQQGAPAQMAQRPPAQVARVAGDNPAQLEADAAYYDKTNPEAARQFRERAAAMQGQQPAPVQMAQAPGAMADVPAQGAQPSQFAVPGQPAPQPAPQAPTLPPNDPFKAFSTEQLYQMRSMPGLRPQFANTIKEVIDRRLAFEGSRNPLDDQYKREQIAKLQREGASANEPPVPPGYRAVRDAQGKLTSFEPVPGGPAEQKIAEGNKKEQLRAEQTQKYGNVVLTAIGDIESLMKGATLPTTGAIGSVLAERAPGTAAHDIKNTLETIRANISFERLNEMRAASPTGGALGNVTDKEGALLANSLAAVQQSSSEGQFRANLMRLRNQFERTVHGRLLTDQERRFASQGDGNPKQAQGAGAVSEGMTATNPQTGQKIMLRGGQWVPVQ